ncbi:MAG: hypothetical protein ACRECT_04940 [Thermoplasmata archaeon]
MLPSYPESKRRAFARNVLQHSLRLKRGENLLVETWDATLPWAESVVLEARILGARPLMVVEDEATYWKSVEAAAANLGQVGTHEWAAVKATHAHIYFYGPLDTDRYEGLSPSVWNRIDAVDHEWFRLIERYGIRSVRFDLGATNESRARRFGIDLDAWRREMIDASSIDPRTLQRDGARVAQRLRRGKEVTIAHPNGTDLTLHLAGRRPKVDDGVVDEADLRAGNPATVMPSGVVTVAVDEGYAEGTLVSNASGAMFVRGAETPLREGTWEFRRGRLTEYSYQLGAEAFRRAYARLGSGKDRPGLLSIGLNAAITSIPNLFDQERGVVTVAIGRNSFLGGSTRTPHFSAYQSVRGATVEVDGQTVIDRGELAVD